MNAFKIFWFMDIFKIFVFLSVFYRLFGVMVNENLKAKEKRDYQDIKALLDDPQLLGNSKNTKKFTRFLRQFIYFIKP
jgi:hypothetical protein